MRNHAYPDARENRSATAPGAVYNAPGVLGVFSRGLSQAAVAAERSQVQLRNPGGSGVLCIVEQIIAATTAAAVVLTGRKGLALATAPARGARDASGNAGSAAIVATGTDADGVIIPVTTHGTPAGESIELTGARETRLYPGDDLTVEDTTDNEALRVTFRWREVSLDLVPPSVVSDTPRGG